MIIKARSGYLRMAGSMVAGICCLMLTNPVSLLAQEKNQRKLAFQHYENRQFIEAATILKSYCQNHPKDQEASYRLAVSLYNSNDLEGSIIQLQQVGQSGKKYQTEVVYLIARVHHHKHLFKDAIRYYKQYLAMVDDKNGHRQEVINDIKRCAEGLRHEYPSDRVFLENMGSNVNSPFDDFSPVASPNVDSRIYFTSNRNLKVADHFSDVGALVRSTQKHDCDMFATEIDNGAWSEAFPLNEDLNSNEHEILQDFSEDGSIAYFAKGPSYNEGSIYLDSFNNESQPPEGVFWNAGIFNRGEQLRGFYLFSDSILIFSSDRQGGFGGYDLYICSKKSDGWTNAINLGPAINGPFDEITPFLAVDGRTLYLSSNRLNSIGGQDVFKSRFDEKMNQWETPQNLSMPINSAADDVHFRLSRNGLAAYFNSDRKTGKGGQDLYAIYFKNPAQEQLIRSTPPVFFMVKDFQLFSESLLGNGQSTTDPVPEILESEWDLASILYREDDQILVGKNKEKLDLLAGFFENISPSEIRDTKPFRSICGIKF